MQIGWSTTNKSTEVTQVRHMHSELLNNAADGWLENSTSTQALFSNNNNNDTENVYVILHVSR